MSYLEAILFSFVQGISEFFPISSSFHLHLLEYILKKNPPPSFFLICHLGTTFSIIFFLKKEIFKLNKKKILNFALALSPLFIGYIIYKTFIPKDLNLKITSIFLIFSSFFLFLSSKKIKQTSTSLKKKDVVFIGIMQTLALLPGISRSGITISAARFRKWEIKEAVKFSFLLAIPTILGGSLIEGYKLMKTSEIKSNILIYFIGFFISFSLGLMTIRYIFSLRSYKKLIPFAIYCFILGILTLVLT